MSALRAGAIDHGIGADVLETLTAPARRASPFLLAKLRFRLGDTQAGFDDLDVCLEIRSSWMLDLAVDPELQLIRGDGRYLLLVKRMGLA